MFNPQSDQAAEQQLKVQRLVISSFDPSMYSSASGSTSILVREPVDRVYLASSKDDSANTVALYNQAVITISDSAGPGQTSGISASTGLPVSDRGAIVISGLASLDTNDCVIVEYVVLQHLA